MIKIEQAVIVEGKYDKIRLSNIIDAVIITTDGFRIFKDKEKCNLIKLLAEKTGIVIMTDSDNAGQLIRKHVEKIAGRDNIVNVYLPCLKGKERRKTAPSAEGLLGVEGIDDEIIKQALMRVGIIDQPKSKIGRKITKTDLFNIGISGNAGAQQKRQDFCRYLNLPETLPSNSLLDVLNSLYGYDDFVREVAKWKEETITN